MNEMRTLMEAIAKINEEELPSFIGHGSDDADIVYAYDEENRYTHSTGRKLQEIGSPSNSLENWYEVMNAALSWNDNEYNDFNADNVLEVLSRFDRHEYYSYVAAREYSPALYITVAGRGKKIREERLRPFEQFVQENQRDLRVSEIHLLPNTDWSTMPVLRLWWD